MHTPRDASGGSRNHLAWKTFTGTYFCRGLFIFLLCDSEMQGYRVVDREDLRALSQSMGSLTVPSLLASAVCLLIDPGGRLSALFGKTF
jgi:hypothetical protein